MLVSMVSSNAKIAPAAMATGHWNHQPSPIESMEMPWIIWRIALSQP
jgi:hypothetical protein